ncbi:MAG: hypothetical protein CMO44_13010 [Verrucomicrobiales bacterium]|nr:hypothetical protein [Verrucomicrobiales bacterium]|tara:strand:- start:25722 stop:26135 length:414 start_codon:yes stop_codon:yes gene_type:complete
MFLSKILWIFFMAALVAFTCNIALQGITKLKQTRVKRLVLSDIMENRTGIEEKHLKLFDSSIILYTIQDDIVQKEEYILQNKKLPNFVNKNVSKIATPSFKSILEQTETNYGIVQILGQKYIAVANDSRNKLALVLY